MTARFAGYVETVEPALAGWVVDCRKPGHPVRLGVAIDGARAVPIVADRPRPDVAAAGLGGANCGFELALPPHLLDGKPHEIELLAADGRPLDLPAWRSPVVLGPVSAQIAPITAADFVDATELLRLSLLESGIGHEAVAGPYVAEWIAKGEPAFGARLAPGLVGYAMLERGPGAAPFGVVALSVLRHYRRKGIGETLLRALLGAVRRAGGIGEVWLAVAPENLPARALYEKLGFAGRADPPPAMFVPAQYLTMLWRPDR